MVRLEEVNPDNWRLGLDVRDDQKDFVASSVVLLARAYAYRNSRSNAFVIYHDDTPVGMALYYVLTALIISVSCLSTKGIRGEASDIGHRR